MQNYKTFKRIIIDDGDNFFSDNQIAIYISRLNTLAIDSRLLNDSITVDMLVLIISHEYLHMASFDNKTKVIGEEDLFSDFFKADVKSMMVKLSSKRKLFIDYMLKFSNLLEEKYSLEGIDNFNNITNKM